MSAYQFSQGERYAIFAVHNERCWLCDGPVSLSDMQVDHTIPESLDGTQSLTQVLHDLGLPADFKVNSFENWRPAHPRCNRTKGDILLTSPLIQAHLQIAARRAPKAREIFENFASDRKINSALQELLVAHERNVLKNEHWDRLIAIVGKFHEKNRAEEERGKPFVLTPWLTIVAKKTAFCIFVAQAAWLVHGPKNPTSTGAGIVLIAVSLHGMATAA